MKRNFIIGMARRLPALIMLISVVVSLLVVTAFIVRLEIKCNDDTFIYFTYARNFVQGRYFAYDPRNIPSEGFTSLTFLLMLIPFEWAGINMMFASALLSIAGFVATGWLALWLLFRNGFINRLEAFLQMPLLLAMLLLNTNAFDEAGLGLDTSWSFFFILAAIIFLCKILKSAADGLILKGGWTGGFFLMLFLSLLSRPENAICAGLLCLYGFVFHPARRKLLPGLAAFVALLLLYATWKIIFFDDFFPTAYYRKLAAFESGFMPGLSYLLAFLKSSRLTIGLVILGMIGYLAHSFHWGGRDRFMRTNYPLFLLVLCGVTNALSVMIIHPLVGSGFRFLFTLQCVSAILLSWLAVRLLKWIAGLFSKRLPLASNLVPLGFVVVLLIIVVWRELPDFRHPGILIDRLDLGKRADLAVAEHHYIRFGKYLKEKLPQHEDIMFVFGDAGAIPYEFGCRFIDTNGLTEPFIARLFHEKDPRVRAMKYARYILEHKPDFIVLNYKALKNGRSMLEPNLQSPFGREMPLEVWQAYKNEGFRYLLSLPMYYDLHIGVNPHSAHIDKIVAALSAYADANHGYRIPGGLIVSKWSQEVHFDAFNF